MDADGASMSDSNAGNRILPLSAFGVRMPNMASEGALNNASSRIMPLSAFGFPFLETDTDDGALDNGQDDEDASEQDDPMPEIRRGDRERPATSDPRINTIDDEVIWNLIFVGNLKLIIHRLGASIFLGKRK